MSVITYPRGSSLALTPHFKRREFDCPCGKCSQTKHDPALSAKLEQFRNEIGRSIGITSGYRDNAYNAKVGGSPRSQHVHGTAADIAVPIGYAGIAATYFNGVGAYRYGKTNFLHVDTRSTKCHWICDQNGVYTYLSDRDGFYPTIQQGSKGHCVKLMQCYLGITADGSFGTKTADAVKAFQKKHGLPADGICGKNTWAAMV